MKHHSKPHNGIHDLSVATFKVLEDYKKKLDAESEDIRQDYERQLIEKGEDDWLRNLAASLIVFYEATGSKQKTEKLAEKLNEKLRMYRAKNIPTQEIVDELDRLTDIRLSLEG